MGIWEWIEQVRSRDEAYRRRLVLGVTFGVTFIIVIVWASSLRLTWNEPVTSGPVAKPEVQGPVGRFLDESKLRIITGWHKITKQK